MLLVVGEEKALAVVNLQYVRKVRNGEDEERGDLDCAEAERRGPNLALTLQIQSLAVYKRRKLQSTTEGFSSTYAEER